MNTLIPITEKYLEYCKFQKRLDNKTLKAYRTDLKQFMLFSTIPLVTFYPLLILKASLLNKPDNV